MDDPSDLWFWVLSLAFGILAGGRLALRWIRIARLIEDTPTSRIRSAAQGYVELSGRAAWLPDNENLAPLTRRPCVWWRFRIQQRSETQSDGRRRESWRTINQGRSSVPFMLDDGTGNCIVQPDGAEIVTEEATTWYGDAPWPTETPGANLLRSGGRTYRYFEERIYKDLDVYVLGGFRSTSSTATTTRDEAVRALLADWKRDPERLVARFDADRDGRVSLGEWERARTEAQRDVDRQAAKRPAGTTIHTVARPAAGQLFLIAAFPQGQLAARFRKRAVIAFAGFIFATLALGWLLQGVLRAA